MSNIELIRLECNNKEFFVERLEKELCERFNTTIKDIPDNYGRKFNWSLINLILDGIIDSYQMIYIDGKFWVGSGGIVREYNNDIIYQGGFRAFSKTRRLNYGLGSKSYAHEYNTKYQIERARSLNCSSIILSFNSYNKQLFDITRLYHLPKIFGKNVFVSTDSPVIFNGVEQWLLMMYLK